jgi:anti-sigma-K factor RskA
MIDARHEELASLYALDLLEGEERGRFETDLAAEPALQQLVVEFRQSAAALGRTAVVMPPPELKERVLDSLATRDGGNLAPVPLARTRANARLIAFRAFVPWAVAACLGLFGLWLGQRLITTQGELDLVRTGEQLARLELQGALGLLEAERIVMRRQVEDLGAQLAEAQVKLVDGSRLAADLARRLAAADSELATLGQRLGEEVKLANLKITALTSLLNNSPEARAIAVWDPDRQEGVLKVEKLPALLPTQDYQLWVVDPQYPNPVDGGVFTVDPRSGEARVSFRGKQPVAAVNAFAVTLERKGGVPKAEGPFVLLGR